MVFPQRKLALDYPMVNLFRLKRAFGNWKRIPELFTCMATSSSPVSVIAAYLGFTLWSYPHNISLTNGARIQIYSWEDLTTVWAVWFGNEYRILKSDKVFIDLGANIGAFASLICSSPDRKIFAVEPFPENASRLSSNLETKIKSGQCRIFANAIDWQNRTLHMPSSPLIPSHSRTVCSEPGIETVRVSTVTIPELVEIADGSVDLLKVDIEGYKYELFENLSLGHLDGIRRIVLEYHGYAGHLKLVDTLTTHRFELKYHKPQSTRGIAEFVKCL